MYKTIDLCAGIGGIRKGFELTGKFKNILSSEKDSFACKVYEHLYGEKPFGDLTTPEFLDIVKKLDFDVLLAGFPCQAFSSVGKKEGFKDETRGTIFFSITEILEHVKHRPKALFFENVENLVRHNNGHTLHVILNRLVKELGYHVIGVSLSDAGELIYNPRKFIKNSKDYGVLQNRPRTYIVAFDKQYYDENDLSLLPNELPVIPKLRQTFKDILDKEELIMPKFYLSQGYLNTLKAHKEREHRKGNGFGYMVVNRESNNNVMFNTVMATGGSGKERNLVCDKRLDYSNLECKTKRSVINDEFIRMLTPNEWGRLQGFVDYAFLDENGVDQFSFPENISDTQKYKLFGNSVTIPVIEAMAGFMAEWLDKLEFRR